MKKDKSNEFNIFERHLQSVGQHLTQPRKTILETFLKVDGHISAKKLYEKVSKVDGQISQATIYRTIKLLVECGLAGENEFAGDNKLYERIHGKEHHDHMVCTKCKKVEEFHNDSIEKLQEEVAQKHYFRITDHRMILFGICHECQ